MKTQNMAWGVGVIKIPHGTACHCEKCLQ